ncbi:MAG TPA: methyltransferase domain-containing protein [Mycobacteriales bacterium]|nr:methyltransferase domain-containing protein [Mycobacteriales bacterium]
MIRPAVHLRPAPPAPAGRSSHSGPAQGGPTDRAPGGDRIAAILAATRGPAVLDVGCTGGLQTDIPLAGSPDWVHQHVRAAFPEVHGIDLAAAKVDFLRQHGYPAVDVADAQDFDLGRQFDTVLAGELIEHLENPAGFLRAATRHLRPGGRIVLTTPYAAGLANVLYAWLKFPRTCSNPEHTMWFCPSTIRVLAQRCGLQVRRWELLADYPAWGASRTYRTLRRVYLLTGRLLPRWLTANTMLVVLEPAAGPTAAAGDPPPGSPH